MGNEIKLLPCPFCGSEADLIEQKHREYASTYYVRCKGCHCKSLERMGVGIVVEAWNTRKVTNDIVTGLKHHPNVFKELEGSSIPLDDAIEVVKTRGNGWYAKKGSAK